MKVSLRSVMATITACAIGFAIWINTGIRTRAAAEHRIREIIDEDIRRTIDLITRPLHMRYNEGQTKIIGEAAQKRYIRRRLELRELERKWNIDSEPYRQKAAEKAMVAFKGISEKGKIGLKQLPGLGY